MKGYLSGDTRPKIVKKQISENVFKDVVIIKCQNCKKDYESNITLDIICPLCNTKYTQKHKYIKN